MKLPTASRGVSLNNLLLYRPSAFSQIASPEKIGIAMTDSINQLFHTGSFAMTHFIHFYTAPFLILCNPICNPIAYFRCFICFVLRYVDSNVFLFQRSINSFSDHISFICQLDRIEHHSSR
jgi:hypothetical protein